MKMARFCLMGGEKIFIFIQNSTVTIFHISEKIDNIDNNIKSL